MSATVEQINFGYCALDSAKAAVIAKVLPRLAAAKKFDFSSNYELTADDWAAIMSSMSAAVEKIDFWSCSLDSAKAAAIAKVLPRLAAAKKFDFSLNDELTADDWAAIMSSMSATVEEINFQFCTLHSAKAAAIAKVLPRLAAAKKFDFVGSDYLFADDWAAIMSSMSATVEEINFRL